MKIKINDKLLSEVEQDVKDRMNRRFKDPKLLEEIGSAIIKDIQYQARRGISSKDGSKFDGLTPEYIEQRKKLEQYNKVHSAYKRTKSNLTFTGQLLDSLKKKIEKGSLSIFFEGDHKPYNRGPQINNRSRKAPKKITNDELAQYVAILRPFFYVRFSLLPQLKNIVIRSLRRKI